MKEFKGTPNGWKLRNERHENIQYVSGGVNHTIYKADIQAELTNKHITEIRGASQFENELKANAHIIATAPELLEALQYLRSWISQMPANQYALEVADTAINKALNL